MINDFSLGASSSWKPVFEEVAAPFLWILSGAKSDQSTVLVDVGNSPGTSSVLFV